MKVAKKYQQQVADAVKEGKKRSLAKQGDGVEEEEEKDSESDGWT
ncbi:16623_t:CDS:1, partial [Rhizophagus irregularis]